VSGTVGVILAVRALLVARRRENRVTP
jgi:hypothetical protein